MLFVRNPAGVSGVVQRKLQRAAAAVSLRARPWVAVEGLEDRRLFASLGLDPTFGGGDGDVILTPSNSFSFGFMVLSDGKMLVGQGQGTDPAVTRLNPDGSRDNTFGGGDGIVGVPIPRGEGFLPWSMTMAVSPSGKIVIGGTQVRDDGTAYSGDLFLARFNANGTVDTSFSGDGKANLPYNAWAQDIVVLPDEKIVVVGGMPEAFNNFAPISNIDERLTVSRVNANGTYDTTFGGAGTGTITRNIGTASGGMDVARDSNGRLYVSGFYADATADDHLGLFRFTANGLVDTTYGGGDGFIEDGFGIPADLLIEPSGNIVTLANDRFRHQSGGDYYRQVLQRHSPAGSLLGQSNWTYQRAALSSSYNYRAWYYGAQKFELAGGKFYVVGADVTASEGNASFIARFNSDLTADRMFNDPADPAMGDTPFLRFAGLSSSNGLDVGISASGRPLVGARGFDEGISGFRIVQFAPLANDDVIATAPAAAAFSTGSYSETYFGRLYNATDVNLRKFVIPAETTAMRFWIRMPSGSGLTPYLRLFDSKGQQVSSDNQVDPNNGSLTLRYTFNGGGTYYLGVSGDGNRNYNAVTGAGDVASSFGDYFLTAETTFRETNARIANATPLALSRNTSGAIVLPRDVNMYSFTVATAGQRLVFDADPARDSTLNGYLRLFNGAGTQLAASDDGPTTNAEPSLMPYLEYTFSAPGTYYVGISGKGNVAYNPISGTGLTDGSVGQYLFSVAPVTTDDRTSGAPAISTNAVVNETLFKGSDVNLRKFTVAAGQTVQFDVDREVNGGLDAYLRLFSGSGQQIAATSDSLGQDPYLSYTFATAGTYYVGVSGKGNQVYNAVTGTGDRAAGVSWGNYTLKTLTTQPPPGDSAVTLQAEAATLGGGTVANTTNRGFTGSGYADFGGAGSFAQFAVNRASAGNASIAIRYANGSSSNRPYRVLVNGIDVGQMVCPPTGSGSTWSTQTLGDVTLSSGVNTIRFVAVGAGADLDRLIINTL